MFFDVEFDVSSASKEAPFGLVIEVSKVRGTNRSVVLERMHEFSLVSDAVHPGTFGSFSGSALSFARTMSSLSSADPLKMCLSGSSPGVAYDVFFADESLFDE